MKTLILVRHAKASRDPVFRNDKDRPLLDIGIARAEKVASILADRKMIPDFFLSSDAARARQTAIIFHKILNTKDNPLHYSSEIYERSAGELVSLLHKLPDDKNVAMLFGHNPGFSNLCNHLTDENLYMNTSSAACIKLNIDSWKAVDRACGNLIFMERGKE